MIYPTSEPLSYINDLIDNMALIFGFIKDKDR